MRRLELVVGAAVGLSACGDRASPGARVYVSNENDGTVSVIDARSHEVIATIPVGKRPRGLQVSPDGATLYVALSGSPKAPPGVDPATLPAPDRAADGIGVVDLDQLRLTRVLESGQDPECFALLPGGRALVVSNEETAEASLVSVDSGGVIARVPVGEEPEGVATHPYGHVVYVTSETDDRIDVVDPVGRRVVARIPTGARPRAIAFTRDGTRAFVTNENAASVTVIDARAHAAVATVALPREGSGPTGPRPMGVIVSRDQRHVLVSGGRGGAITVVDAATLRVVRTIGEVGPRPWGLAVAADDRVYVANGPSDDVAVIDVEAGRVLARIPAGASPWGVAASP